MAQDPGRLVVVRHGPTAWSAAGRHTGRTDIPLTLEGEGEARALAPRLGSLRADLVLASPLQRARRTAELAGLDPVVDPDLQEWDYGDYEGRTTHEIRESLHDPSWSVWTTTTGLGETLAHVGERASRVLATATPLVRDGGTVVLTAHAHLLRILTAIWLGLGPAAGAAFVLEPAGVGALGYERGTPVLLEWNS